jgi:hypothetical protein
MDGFPEAPPEFAATAANVVWLCIAPPENATVICMDEKFSTQAPKRAQVSRK